MISLSLLRYPKTFLLNLFFPPICLGCKKEGAFVCPDCFKKITTIKNQVCPGCERQSAAGQVCANCRTKEPRLYLDGLIIAARYAENPLLQNMIKTFKFRYNVDLIQELGNLMVQSLNLHLITAKFSDGILTPVPLHFWRRNQRGFNQSELLAAFISKKINRPWQNILKRIKHTPQQSRLKLADRLINVRDAFAVKQIINPQKTYILVDDVATTLSTLNECAKALKQNQAAQVFGLVVARG